MTAPTLLDDRLPLFPMGTGVSRAGALTIQGIALDDLAARHGTPLYVLDETTLDGSLAAYREALRREYAGEAQVTMAGKALLCVASAQWADRRGIWLDCTGAGELGIAAAARFPRARTLVHGVNKSDEDLDAALAHAAVIVVDNLSELARLLPRLLAAAQGARPAVWLRVRPGVAVDTHAYRQTGQSDSKFGLDPAEAVHAVALCQEAGVGLEGIHFHQGSHFHDPAPVGPGLSAVLDLVEEVRDARGWTPAVLSPGGGWGVPYHEDDLPHKTIADYVRFVGTTLASECQARGLPLPRLHVEPGRSIVARAGVAIYKVGAVKESGGRRWLLVDGGMADNPRPALYGARYAALPTQNPGRPALGRVWIAGPYCESGDILIQDLAMPDVREGEHIAIPVSGAYHLNMGSNYNGARRPAVVWLRGGESHLVQRRETVEDLLRRDLPLPA